MDEVGGALIAISLVLIVFLPTAFIAGLRGSFYRQFAITIAASTAISAFVSLTLSPALAALLLKPHDAHATPEKDLIYYLATPVRAFFNSFNWGFERLADAYGAITARFVRLGMIFLILYGGLLGLTYWRLMATPTGLIPQLDQTYLIAAFQLPPGSTLNRTDEVERGASDIMLTRPGVKDAVAFVGFDGATFTNAPNTDVTFVNLKSFEDARRKALPRTRSSRTCARR